ncbi:hypothetical protein C9374_010966 [Naegleria lovaniensis]|uniref:Uncharacterized protein n=1 Tax=Naegleria lovaniensis TaxID=51637 RepID=A0AA88GD90_NAELO|nr:uncharacterized protein C9374_010966 [Naegleria lovaniensis]KAG2374396.1 hypothetical protein C9374_010966 [Naegleria lovaniensis]
MSSLLKNIAFHPFHLGNNQQSSSNNNNNTSTSTTTPSVTTSPVRKNSIAKEHHHDEGQSTTSGLEVSSTNTSKHSRLGSGMAPNALINENNLSQHFQHSTSLSMPKQQEDQEMKKKLKILKKEYLKQKAEMERLAQIALGQQEEIKHKDFQLKKYKQQCEEQASKIGELETQLQIERELCEGAIRMKKQTTSTTENNNNQSANTQQTENDLSLLLDEGLTTKDVMEKTYQFLKDDTFTFMLNTEEYQEEETISSLKQEIAALREENFYLREEKHKLNNEKVHLFELVHQLTQQLGLGNEDKN